MTPARAPLPSGPARLKSGGGPPQSKTLAHCLMTGGMREASWTAPAERSGDGALDGSRTVVETLASCVPCPQNPKRRGASLPAALQKPAHLRQHRSLWLIDPTWLRHPLPVKVLKIIWSVFMS
jgi:hypothetical protein